MNDTHAIDLRGVTCKLGKFQLGPLNFAAPRGSVVAFIGPNGAGKTTTLDMLMGLGRPDDGEIRVLGLNQAANEVWIKARTAYVNPDMNFAAWGKVGRALNFIRGFYPDWDDARCERLLKAFELKRSDRIMTLSFGARIKLSLVMALARDAELLLLDEPTVGLDVNARRILFAEILDFIKREDRTVVISSHQLADLERLADHVAILNQGQLIAMGRMDELLDRYVQIDAEIAHDGAMPSLPGVRVLEREGGRVRLLIDTSLAGRADLAGFGVKEVAETPMTLEDLFVALVSE
ncbi:ABC transporter ATP-binding protein [soil metagenome]